MNKPIDLGTVVAERELSLVRSDGSKDTVTVRIGTPYEEDDTMWACPYQIQGPNRTKTFRMGGLDSMQALLLTTQVILPELDAWARHEGGTFQFCDDHDTGFPDYEQNQSKF